MTTITSTTAPAALARAGEGMSSRMGFMPQILMMTRRSLVTALRDPVAVIPGFIINIFFLLIFSGSLGNASNFLPGLSGKSYLGFILPFSVISAALGTSGIAGQAIVRDIERGYFDKLMLTPVNRWALLLSPMIATGLLLMLQTLLVIGVAVVLGLRPETGVPGVLLLMLLSLLTGLGFAGFTVGIALRTGSAAATQGAGFMFFPLSFLTATFVPLELLSGWIKTAATINPITYIIDAGRMVLNNGWDADVMFKGLLACSILGVLMFAFALFSLRARTRRK
jgi:ABC-2 type transport system permease protein